LNSSSSPAIEQLAAAVAAGDRQALARAVTLAESARPDHRRLAAELLERLAPRAGGAFRIGVSGVPGAGKSTFIETFGLRLVREGRRVAVLSVDPSSPASGGSILGDKTRMSELARSPQAFIRPSPSGGTLGGVARRTREALLLCEAAGFDVVLVETVGVGQSETAVAGMTDLFLLLLVPGGGDELQGMKRGIVELADLVLVNKADGDLTAAAERAVEAYRAALTLLRPRTAGWQVPVEACSSLDGSGIGEAWKTMQRYRDTLAASGELAARRAAQAAAWLWSETAELLLERLREHPGVRERVGDLERAVQEGALPPTVGAQRLLEIFLASSCAPSPAAGAVGRLNHVAVAVPDLAAARAAFERLPGARVSEPKELPEHGVTAVLVALPNTAIELVTPLGERSPLASFLEKNPGGGIHHLALEVPDVRAAAAALAAQGARVLGGGEPKTGAHGAPVLFLHPKDFAGTLVELEET
jgi:LAO/AO transport system kinase